MLVRFQSVDFCGSVRRYPDDSVQVDGNDSLIVGMMVMVGTCA